MKTGKMQQLAPSRNNPLLHPNLVLRYRLRCTRSRLELSNRLRTMDLLPKRRQVCRTLTLNQALSETDRPLQVQLVCLACRKAALSLALATTSMDATVVERLVRTTPLLSRNRMIPSASN